MSAESCPLLTGLYWENRDEIPDVCIENCDKFMGASQRQQYGEYDVFTRYVSKEVCDHPDTNFQTSDCSLQRGVEDERIFSVTDECGRCREEIGAQSYVFKCPND